MTKIILIFESRLTTAGPNEQIFIEARDESGKSINVGDWAADGEHETLTIDCAKYADATLAQRIERAERALKRGGWTYRNGAEAWKPPLGPSPFAVKELDDVTAIAIDPGNALASDYMRGMANGLILAQSIFKGGDPLFIEANGNRSVRSADEFKTGWNTNNLEGEERKTFVIPDGFEAVRDSEGRATGELRKLS